MKKTRLQILLYMLTDYVGSIVVLFLFSIVRGQLWTRDGEWDPFFLVGAAIFALAWLLVYAIAGLYNKPFRRSRLQELSQIFKYTLIGVLIFFFIFLLDEPIYQFHSYRVTFTTFLLLQFSVIGSLRFLITTRTNIAIQNRKLGFPTLVIGCGPQALRIYEELENRKKSLGYQFKGYVCIPRVPGNAFVGKLKHLGHIHELTRVIQDHQIEEIIIALERNESEKISEVIEYCERTTANIQMVPGIYDYIVGSVKISHILGAPLIEIFPQLMKPWEQVLKRFLDIVVSIFALLILTPVYAVLALLIKLDSKGPIFFRQERIGKGGAPFFIFKFRSMYTDAEKAGPALSKDRDPRITRVGLTMRKLRLDELPQFWNVLRGDMSLVGPRPERQYYIDLIMEKAPHYRHLHKIRPGITSWGQVKYGYASNVDQMIERLKFDILYLEQMSFALDIKIILYTFLVIVEGRGK